MPSFAEPVRPPAQLKSEGATPALTRRPVAETAPTAAPSPLPGALRSGAEALGGFSLADVKVHRNSPEPAKLGALAFARGSHIHLGPGQERHLPHETWHVVQQKQGRVKGTTQMMGVGVNDDAALEAEATALGERSVAQGSRSTLSPTLGGSDSVQPVTVQLRRIPDAVASSQQLPSEKDAGAEAGVENAATLWPYDTYDIGRFFYHEGDFSGTALVPPLAGNVATILTEIKESTAICWRDQEAGAVDLVRAASLGINVLVSGTEFPPGLILKVIFSKKTRKPQQASDRFAALLKDMPDQRGLPMGKDHYKR